MSLRKNLGIIICGLGLSTLASATTSNDSTNLANGLRQAKAAIDRVIASAGGGAHSAPSGYPSYPGSGGGSSSGPGNVHWSEGSNDVVESDAIGLPILIQASTSLGQAASFSDESTIAYLGGNIQFGNFRFAQSCNEMGISRSQIARGNQAALQPPVGFLQAFGPDLAQTLVELQQLKFAVGCP